MVKEKINNPAFNDEYNALKSRINAIIFNKVLILTIDGSSLISNKIDNIRAYLWNDLWFPLLH